MRSGSTIWLIVFILLTVSFAACGDSPGPVSPPGNQQPVEWVLRSPYPTAEQLHAFDWISPVAGVAVGDNGTLLLTEDACETWTPKPAGTSRLNMVDFADQRVGFAAGDGGVIFRTTNAGRTWHSLDCGIESDLFDISAVDANTCTIVGEAGMVLRSDDGGATWIVQSSGTTDDLHSVSFADANHGAAVHYWTLIYTSDGGRTWIDKSANLPRYMLIDVFMAGPATIIAACHWAIFRSEDAGDSWQGQLVDAYLYSMSFADASTGWAIGITDVTPSPTRVFTTTNGGVNWRMTLHNDIAPGHLSFLDVNNGMLVGEMIHVTSDGGRSWVRKDKGTRARIMDVTFLDSQTAVAVGSDGVILRSTDGGRVWNQVRGGDSMYLTSLSFADSSTGLAVASSGAILKTSDGGMTWTPLNSGISGILFDIHMLDQDRAIAAGIDMIRTTNGGSTWERLDPPVSYRYHGVRYINEQRIIAVGFTAAPPESTLSHQGMIVRSENGGIDWSADYFPDVQWLYDVAFISDDCGTVVGDGYSIYRTIDGGDSWAAIQVGLRGRSLQAVEFGPEDIGYAVGDFGVILHSNDRGVSWRPEESNVTRSLLGIAVSDDRVAVAVGQSGTILSNTGRWKNSAPRRR